MVSNVHTTERQMIGSLVNNELKRLRKKAMVA
jgi:hypothetical protein